ncbi:protein-L-isoaspartate O-methyltransferase [Paenalcaligenes niemegkensis]|uniref:protein-L-isoaspartate O-methyltransferase family protein n=1 Tax=Paenalcaligenes niemegkensis TaxID=2895469 RepID=UPI001EE8261F|nr:protein-L-isoaspartate O-methyltransferase [Paenalcaligenes niemegkensis]MCQ9615539.1 protein-L-isoaspartate O-methyltransferase [Paenalcaligenes niemegkensis]
MNIHALSELELARYYMVEQQIRPWHLYDENVLQSLLDVKRERFVPPSMEGVAFSDTEIPLIVNSIDTNETMLSPVVEARLAQELQLKPTDGVLEIGTGSGYQAALLASLCQHVTTIEVNSTLAAFAKDNLQRNNVNNVTVETGDAHAGWGTTEYDAILLTGSVPTVPDALKYQLAIGGRLVAVVGQAPVMVATRITRTSAASFETEPLFDTIIKPLHGTAVSHFKF